MKQDVGENRSDISKLQQDSAFVHQKIDFLEHRLERMDTASRGRNLKFFGIYEPGPWEHWNDVGEIVAVLNNFSKRWWDTSDIESSYRIGRLENGSTRRPLIVTFCRLNDRMEILKDSDLRGKLREENIRVSTDLTLHQREQTQQQSQPYLTSKDSTRPHQHASTGDVHDSARQYSQHHHPNSNSGQRPFSDNTHPRKEDQKKTSHNGSGKHQQRQDSKSQKSPKHPTTSSASWSEWAAASGWIPGGMPNSFPPIYDMSQWPPLLNNQNLLQRSPYVVPFGLLPPFPSGSQRSPPQGTKTPSSSPRNSHCREQQHNQQHQAEQQQQLEQHGREERQKRKQQRQRRNNV